MDKGYVEQRDGGYWIGGTRVSLESVAIAFLQGFSAETIVRECYPTLSLEQAYGAIAYYLAHRAEIDSYLRQADAEFEQLRQATRGRVIAQSEKLAGARSENFGG